MGKSKSKPRLWLIDTSVFLNILDVPGFNQHREEVLSDFKTSIQRGDSFFLPYPCIVETGNHIAQLNGNIKYVMSQKFIEQIKQALHNEAPFKPLRFPEKEVLYQYIDGFPELAAQGIGFGDFTIIQDWKEQKELHKGYSVRIWSLDDHLQGYQS